MGMSTYGMKFVKRGIPLSPRHKIEICGPVRRIPGGRSQRVYVQISTDHPWWKLWTWRIYWLG